MTAPAAPEGARPVLSAHHDEAIDEIVRCVEDGIYCALLGPRLSGKTRLLRFVEGTLASSLGWTCVYVDLYDTRASTLQGFFADLMCHTASRISEISRVELSVPEAATASSAVFRGFLGDSVGQLGRDLVLIIEHLEAVPTDLVQALLTSLRAAYMDLQTSAARVVVVVSGALSLATLTVGESSPFRGIARRVFVGNLSASDSTALISEELDATGVVISGKARQRLLGASQGDPFLIRRLCRLTVNLARSSAPQRVRGRTVREAGREFLESEVSAYAPLQEAVRLLEEDPDLMRCVLLLLAHGSMPKAELPLPLSPDLDPLYLTGVVEQAEGDRYRIQNEIYRKFLQEHFSAGRVGRLLTMAGQWDTAIDYLEAGIQEGNAQAQVDLLSASVNAMYAAEDVGQAARYLARALSAAFGVVDARVWYAAPQESILRLVGHLGPMANGALWKRPEMSRQADRLEARAFREVRALRGQEGERYVWRAIPLALPGHRPIGVVTVCDDLAADHTSQERDRELQLLAYLNQAARAMQSVSTRRQELALAGRMQASLLPVAPPTVEGWQLAATLRPARETSGDFFDFVPLSQGRLGLVIADVADKGMGAALYMALARTLIRTYASDHPDMPDLVLKAVNERILADTESGLFVTVFYGILDPAEGKLTYCNAGHHPPYLIPSQGQTEMGGGDVVEALPGRCMALGVVESADWDRRVIAVPVGASLVFYTDGIVDAPNSAGGRFGNDGILAVIREGAAGSADALRDKVVSALQQFMGDEPQFDDITLMIVRRESA